MKSIITDGQLASNIPAENLKASSTSEWVQEFLEHYKMHYNVSYDKDHYVWSAIVTYDGEPCHNEKTFTTLDANNLPQGVDLKGASVAVYETGKDGITFPAEIELSELSIESGKVNVEGNVSSVTVVDDSRFYFTTDPGCFFLHVKGNVSKLLINDISANTNIIVDGNVTEGSLKTLKTGVDFHFQEDFATFSKKVGQTSDIIEGGTLNHNFMLSTGEGDNALSYSIDNNLVDLETAAGVTDATRATEYEAVDFDEALQYQSAGARLLLKTLDENTVQAIESKVDLEDGYQITNKAVDIKVGTFYICGGLKPSKKITSTSTPLKINIVIPDYKEGVKYGIVRVHDNGDGTTSYDVLPTSVLNGVISFASDKFSDFVLINNDGGIDVTAPSISNNYQKDATSMEVTVTDSGSGVDTVSYTIDNGAAQTAVLTNGKFTIPSLKEGRYNVVVTAKDKSGNKSSQTIPVVSLYTVNFFYGANDDSEAFATEIVEYGNDASAPIVAKRPGFDSVGWSKSFTKVVSDIDVEALWNITGVKVTPYTGTYDRNTHNMISIDGLNPSDVVSYRTDGKLYTTNCPSVTAAGNYSVYVKIDREGLDTWYSPKYTIAVTKKAITASMINKLPTVEFNGKQYCPVPVITDGTYTLKEGTDFTLTYLNNRNSGTAHVHVIGKGNYAGNVELSFQILEKKGEVKIKDNKTPQVAATNLNKLYEDETIYTPEDRQIEENGGTVNIKLEVQSQIVPVADQSKIKQIAKDKKIGLFLDISLFKMVQLAGATNGNTSQISHTNQLLSIVIPIPDEVKGRKGVELYRVHNGVPAIIPIGAENAINGEYCTIDSKNITLYVRNFSTYAIGYSTSDIKSPKTGEESSQLPWILLGFGLAAVGTGVVVRKKRKCKLILK